MPRSTILDPGRGRTKAGRLWVYARDDRPWAGPEPPAAVYFYSGAFKLVSREPGVKTVLTLIPPV